ncbi:DUF7344 domain-containing protein [Halomicrococcus sp. NG-SE-24]|uniref:DUF7344 domain-containing protein n=1 Tax=Halomicrococcus sp. NG-SE-24 TaxID=3436928 RepID=UPI003D9517C6
MASSDLSQDDLFEVLKSTRRRYVLYYLRRDGPTAELSILATHVAAWEQDSTPEELTPQQRKRGYISLYQTHLPRLEDADLLEFDADAGTVQLSDHAYLLDDYLSANSPSTKPWYRYYLSLSLVSFVLLGGVWGEISPFVMLSQSTAIPVILSLYALLALGQYLYHHRHAIRGLPPGQ